MSNPCDVCDSTACNYICEDCQYSNTAACDDCEVIIDYKERYCR